MGSDLCAVAGFRGSWWDGNVRVCAIKAPGAVIVVRKSGPPLAKPVRVFVLR
ncbi:hypothetical protein PS854_03425 [Pseudomonas fluorescens]|uniref:Uncharacterized protein n=1 Tax=Pseudomonas fluorescens TaxID=294 RepID=A0A5E7LMZ6_PSEFL|nr:hypothetical protein PS854_03425 [Pseudomonas fluorescens]